MSGEGLGGTLASREISTFKEVQCKIPWNRISFPSYKQTRVSHCGFSSGRKSLFCLEIQNNNSSKSRENDKQLQRMRLEALQIR
jgi:hypothetical protein